MGLMHLDAYTWHQWSTATCVSYRLCMCKRCSAADPAQKDLANLTCAADAATCCAEEEEKKKQQKLAKALQEADAAAKKRREALLSKAQGESFIKVEQLDEVPDDFAALDEDAEQDEVDEENVSFFTNLIQQNAAGGKKHAQVRSRPLLCLKQTALYRVAKSLFEDDDALASYTPLLIVCTRHTLL